MFSRWLAEFMKAVWMSRTERPRPTFSPTRCQFDTWVPRLELCHSLLARAISSARRWAKDWRSGVVVNAPRRAAVRSALVIEVRSSPAEADLPSNGTNAMATSRSNLRTGLSLPVTSWFGLVTARTCHAE